MNPNLLSPNPSQHRVLTPGVNTRCYLGLLMGLVLLSSSGYAAIKDRSGADSVERRQKADLQQYYYGNVQGGRAPMMPIAIELYNQAVQFFEGGEYDIAREAVLESLQIEQRNALAWELLAEIENLKQDFKKAKEYYKKSYLITPAPRVKDKIERLNKEQLLESKLDTYQEEHFIIKYKREDPRYEGHQLKNILHESYRMISQDFGYYIRNKTVVIFYEGDEFHYVTGQPGYIGGLYDGKIRLPAYRKWMGEQELRASIVHEMTHAFVAYMSRLRAPAWIQEGLAEYEENKIRPVHLTLLKAVIKSKQTIPLNEFLLSKLDLKNNPEELTLFYQQAFSFVSYLVKRFGMYRIKEMLQKFGQGNDSFAAIEEVFKISPARLEREWLATLR